MRKVIVFFLTVACISISAQKYQPNWESLDKRPIPQWFKDAKFGIFITWGIYSVPAWGPTGDSIGVYDKYAEWYWNKLIEKSKVQKYFQDFHLKTYGPNFKYQDFAPMFKAELFDPDQWADLFKEAGANYVVLVTKHHDGYCLWPSAQSVNWNSVDIGPHRDICNDLTEAVRKKGIHMGLYYSIYEWYHPYYMTDLNRFVDEHLMPQIKDLVVRYKPDVLWTDGEWEKTSKEWKSEQFLAWLYNESPVKEYIVVNDRWGSECRSHHGGYYTLEYGLIGDKKGLDNNTVPYWEENRGIGGSFGFNRTENVADYATSKQLIELLVRTVTAGGNLLLNIGPAADGTIPVIMQQRLLDMGKWLKTNGEAIYGTTAFIMNLKDAEINPETNKTIFFTQKGRDLFVIRTQWHKNNIILKGLKTSGKPDVSLLGSNVTVNSIAEGVNITITPPVLTPDDYQLSYVFKISNIRQ